MPVPLSSPSARMSLRFVARILNGNKSYPKTHSKNSLTINSN